MSSENYTRRLKKSIRSETLRQTGSTTKLANAIKSINSDPNTKVPVIMLVPTLKESKRVANEHGVSPDNIVSLSEVVHGHCLDSITTSLFCDISVIQFLNDKAINDVQKVESDMHMQDHRIDTMVNLLEDSYRFHAISERTLIRLLEEPWPWYKKLWNQYRYKSHKDEINLMKDQLQDSRNTVDRRLQSMKHRYRT